MAKRPRRGVQPGVGMLDNPQGEKPQESQAEQEARVYNHWMDEITAAKKVFKPYWERGRKIVKLYKDDRKESPLGRANDRMNILWSNVETLKPALYSKTPQPNVSRRFLDSDPVSRTASLILERCLVTAIDLADFDYPMNRATLDYLLPGRGSVWVRYAPTMGMAPMREPVTKIALDGTDRTIYRPMKGGEEIDASKVKTDDDGLDYYETEPEEQVLSHGLDLDHLLWSDLVHDPVNDWSKVGWAAKRVDMKRPKLIKEFGDKGRKVQLNRTFNAKIGDGDAAPEDRGKANCAEVWEIWSKDHSKVFWLTDALPNEVLKELDDPLGLSDFWPLPRPIFATTTTDSLIPVPDYALYQDQAEQLDRLTDRIRLLIQALRVVGVYNAEIAALAQLLSEASENEMVPVENWIAFAQSGGLKGNLDWLPIEEIATVLTQLFQARAQIKQDLYEVTGISDVIRGATAPQETATAQQIKANFGNLRIQARQTEMARFARDTIRKMAEIMAEHFPEEDLIEMSGVRSLDEFKPTGDPQKDAQSAQKIMAAVQLLKSDRLRTFKIDIETDATVAPDQQAEKESRVEFLTAVAPFLEKAAQVGQMAPQLVPLLMKMLDFGVKGFRAGRTLESAIEETIQLVEKMQQQADAQGPQAPPPDPQAEAMAAKLQAETQKLQAELQELQAQAQVKAQENEAKRIEAEERKAREREAFQRNMLKLTEDIQARRLEHEEKCKLLQLQIAKAELELQQLHVNGGVAEVQAMLPQEEAVPEPSPEEAAASSAEMKTKLAKSQVELAELKVRFAEMQRRASGLDGIGDALGEIGADNLGSPEFAKPRRKGPTKKVVGFIRDPDTNELTGATVDDIEMPPEEDGGEEAA